MKPGMDQTVEDVDELAMQLDELSRGQTVELTWTSTRSGSRISAVATVMDNEDESGRIITHTTERKSNIRTRRRGDREITVVGVTDRRAESMGWLLEVETAKEM